MSRLYRILASLQRPETFFLALASFCGLIAVFVMPPYMVPDEGAHFYHAYQISEGKLFSSTVNGHSGGYLPPDLSKGIHIANKPDNSGVNLDIPYRYLLTHRINSAQRTFTVFDQSAVYSPVAYIPQTIGVLIGRILYPSQLVLLYMARLFNAAAFIALTYLAIRWVPVKKWLFVAAALLPMTIHQFASASSDVMTIGLIFVAVAYVLHLAIAADKIGKREFIISFLIAAGLGLTKQTSCLAIIPFLFLRRQLFATTRTHWGYKLGVAGVAFITTLAWYALTKVLHYNFAYSGVATVDMAGQVKYILHHPLSLAVTFFHTFFFNTTATPPSPSFYWTSLVGVFSWILYELPQINVLFAYATLLAGFLYFEKKELPLYDRLIAQPWLRWSFAAVVVASIAAVALVLYLVWTPVGAPVIAGIQGRYFIPLLPMLIPLFLRNRISLVTARSYVLPLIFAILILCNFATMEIVTVSYFH